MKHQRNFHQFIKRRQQFKIQLWRSFVGAMGGSYRHSQTIHPGLIYIFYRFILIRQTGLSGFFVFTALTHMSKLCFHRYAQCMSNFNNLCRLFHILLKGKFGPVHHNRAEPQPDCLNDLLISSSMIQIQRRSYFRELLLIKANRIAGLL